VERDSYAIWWYNRLKRPELDLSHLEDYYIRDLQIQMAETGPRFWALDVTSDLGIPSFVAVSHWTENLEEYVEFSCDRQRQRYSLAATDSANGTH
jgi:ribosomal protein S12 methylthiotransferase accessory factor YcaO